MSTGSANTVGVAGEYWINSTSSLRITTLPGVAAMSRPMTNFSVPLGPLPCKRALDVLEPMTESAYQVCARFDPGRVEQFRVGRQIVGGRERLERIASHEIQRALVVPGDTGHARPGLLPPIDVVAVGVRVDVEGPLRPRIAGEAGIALCRRQRLAAGGLQGKRPVIERLGGRILQDLAVVWADPRQDSNTNPTRHWRRHRGPNLR